MASVMSPFIRRQEIATRCVRERIIVVMWQAVTISFTRGTLPLVRTTVVSLARVRFLPTGYHRKPVGADPRRLPLFLLHFGPRRAEARGGGRGVARCSRR